MSGNRKWNCSIARVQNLETDPRTPIYLYIIISYLYMHACKSISAIFHKNIYIYTLSINIHSVDTTINHISHTSRTSTSPFSTLFFSFSKVTTTIATTTDPIWNSEPWHTSCRIHKWHGWRLWRGINATKNTGSNSWAIILFDGSLLRNIWMNQDSSLYIM